MRKHNTESIGEVLKQFFEENRFFKQKLAESRVITGWEKVLGSVVASYTENIYLRNNILYVHLTSSVLRAELVSCKDRLITNLNNHAGMNVVKDILFR
jgi:predicted nucleic acid-binding Zn ribbon protein